MLINVLLFWLLVLEAALCLVLSLPVGQSASLAAINFLSKQLGGRDSKAATAATVLLAVVSLLFLSDVSTVYKHHASDEVLSDGLRIRLLTAQRDMYISGFCLFLFLLLRLVYIAMATNLRLDKSLAAMKKQAENAAAGYKALLEENEAVKKQAAKIQELLSDDGADADKKRDVLAKLMQENAQLAIKVEATGKELKQAEAKVEAVKKQAEGQSSAFMKLMDEKIEADKQTDTIKELEQKVKQQAAQLQEMTAERDSLRTQIQDYDFMFTDAKKKAE